jgi:hypothetical protein
MSYSLDDDENIIGVRASDGRTTRIFARELETGIIPDPLMHCLVAIDAHLAENNDIS